MAAVNKDLKEIERRKSRAVKRGDLAEASRLCNTAGELLSSHGMYYEAIEWHKEELKFSEAAEDITGTAISHRKIGECCCELGQFSRALRHQKKHLFLAQSIASRVEEQRAYATIGRTLFVQSDNCESEIEREKCLVESQEAYLSSLALSDKLKGEVFEKEILEMKARLCLNLGLVFEWRNNFDQAEKFMEKALITSRENNLKENMYRCYLSLSGVTARNNKLQESLRHAKRAQHSAKEKGNTTMEADAVLQIGQGLLKLGEFTAAIQVFKQSHKLSPPELEDEQQSFMSTLKLAFRGEKYMQQLRNCEDEEERVGLYEKLGDIYGEAKSPIKALEFYEKQLELAQKLDKDRHTICAIYVSLAITHAENRDEEKALEYYNKELDIRTKAGYNKDFKETSATYSAIAKLQEDTGKDVDTVKETYLKSLEYAKKSGSIPSQIKVSRELNHTYQKFGLLAEHEALKKEIEELEKLNVESDSEDSQSVKDEDKHDDDDDDDEIEHLLAPSDSSDEETSKTRRSAAYQRNSRRKRDKLNDKGETPLHVACINGNTDQVKDLLSKGSSVHVRDHCGWQPLHEASNFGHTEIVKLLVSYGANVNDPGGDHCGRITPLHDASQNGHLATVQFLIKNGADPQFQDSKGRTPLDLVEKSIKADEDELDDSESDVLHNRRNVRRFLKQVMVKNKPTVSLRNRNVLDQTVEEEVSDDDNANEDEARYVLSRKIAKAIDTNNDAHLLDRGITDDRDVVSNQENMSLTSSDFLSQRETNRKELSSSGSPYVPDSHDRMDTDEDSTYASMDEDIINPTISPLKPLTPLTPLNPQPHEHPLSSNDPANSETSPFTVVQSEIPSSSESDAEIVYDTFIVDDVGQRRVTKKRRIDGPSRKRTVQSTIPTGFSNFNTKRKNVTSSKSSKSKLRKQTKLTTTYTVGSSSSDHGFTVNTAACAQRSGPSKSSLATKHARPEDSDRLSSGPDDDTRRPWANQTNLMRIRVRVENELLLIPCADSAEKRTVSWLADQASQRYSSSIGMSPKLTLKTKEGAMLCPGDFISDVLLNNEEVHAVINGWNAGFLHEKYENECACLPIRKRDDVIDVLSQGDSLSNVNMRDFHLKPRDMRAISKAFVGHSRLSRIDLTGNNFGNEGLVSLCSALQYLPSLTSLILVCTGITSAGLLRISESLCLKYQSGDAQHSRQETPHPLEELDCSYNSMEDVVRFIQAFKEILRKCNRLKKLVFDHCCICARNQADLSSSNLSTAYSSIKSLLLAGNPDITFINRILPRFESGIQELDLSGDSLHSQEFQEKLFENLQRLVESHESCLQNLSLREMNLEDPVPLITLLSNGNFRSRIQVLDISGSCFKDQRIFRSIADISSLKELNLSRNDSLDSDTAEFFLKCLATSRSSLSILKMTSCDIQSLSGEFIASLGQCKYILHVDLSFNDTCYGDKQDLADWWSSRSHVRSEYCIVEDFCVLNSERTSNY